jgi:hypothetical protein
LELLRLSIQARWTTIFERSEQTSMIRALWNVFEDLNTVVYVLRWDARVLSGTPRIAQMLTFVGPVGGAKSWLVMRLTVLLGEGPSHLAHSLASNYLHEKLKKDPEGPRACTRDARGAKLLCFKEMPQQAINPIALKGVLDGRDSNVSARANSATAMSEASTFKVTWSLVGQSNSATIMPLGSHGLSGKMRDVTCEVVFHDAGTYDKTNPRHRRADPNLADRTLSGELNSEVLFWAQALWPTLKPDICTGRNLVPTPPSVIVTANEAEQDDAAEARDYPAFIRSRFEESTREHATPCAAVKGLLEAHFGTMTQMQMTEAALGPSAKKHFRGGDVSRHHDLYLYVFTEGSAAAAMKRRLV